MNNNKQNEYTNSYDVTVNLKNIDNKHNLGLLLEKTFEQKFLGDEYDFEGYDKFELQEIELPQKDIVAKMEGLAKNINKNINYTLFNMNDSSNNELKTAIEPTNGWTEDDKNKVASFASKFFKYMYEEHFEEFQEHLMDSDIPSFLKEQLNNDQTFGLLIDSITDYGRDDESDSEEDEEEEEEEDDEEEAEEDEEEEEEEADNEAEEEEEEADDEAEEEEKVLTEEVLLSMTKKELVDLCKINGIPYSRKNKTELTSKLKESLSL